MPYKPTGNPVGRPPKENPLLTYSFKCDEALMDEAKEYAWKHRTSVGELLRDGLRWRVQEESDPLAYRYVAPPVQEKNGIPTIPEKSVPLVADDLETLPTPQPLSQPARAPGALDPSPVDTSAAYPPFDTTRHFLGDLCEHGHDYHGTGQSKRRLAERKRDQECLECQAARTRARRQRKALRQAQV